MRGQRNDELGVGLAVVGELPISTLINSLYTNHPTPRVLHERTKSETTGSWEGSNTLKDKFVDLKVSTEGWIAAATQKGSVFTWDPVRDFEMTRQPAIKMTNVTCLDVLRF